MVQGGQEPEFEVQPDPAKLVQAGSHRFPTFSTPIGRSNMIDSPGPDRDQSPAGPQPGQRAGAHARARSRNIVVKTTPAGVPVRIGDVAAVRPSVMPVYTVVTANGKPAVLLNVYRQPDSNTVAVADAVHARDRRASARTLPQGVELRPFYDQSDIVNDSIDSVRDAILIGLVLASLIMVLFLRDWGTSLVAGLVIPATHRRDLHRAARARRELQPDDARRPGRRGRPGDRRRDRGGREHRHAPRRRPEPGGSDPQRLREIRVPLVGSTITPIVVFLPLISITGVTGVFFRALAITVGMALLTSLALALTWTPTLSHYFIRQRASGRRAPHDARRGVRPR